MSNLVFTMWQNDKVILDLWISYYSKHFDKIYLICHSTKEEYFFYLEELKEKFNLDYQIISESKEDASLNATMLSQKQADFIKDNDWVLYCNCDEFLVPDGNKYKTLKSMLKHSKENYIACEGYEVVQVEGEDSIDFSKPYLKQRKYWLRNKNYNKIILSRVPLNWHQGEHRLMEMHQKESVAIKDTGLYLIHLKHADVNPMGPRDFGPHKTNLEPWVMEHTKPEDYLIIPDIVKQF